MIEYKLKGFFCLFKLKIPTKIELISNNKKKNMKIKHDREIYIIIA